MEKIIARIELEAPIEEGLLQKIERIGRVCYKSERLITEDSATNFVRMLLKRGHESVLEHGGISVRVTCDRGVTHEIVRHRVASYSQESTRYCNYGSDRFGNGIQVIDIMPGLVIENNCSYEQRSMIYATWLEAMLAAETYYLDMLKYGATPQMARSVLPTSVKSELIMTMNLREWRHFLKLRKDKTSHPQMREIAEQILLLFNQHIPVVFEDL